jgi:putative transposase
MRRQFTPQQKAAVAFAALKGDKTINQIAAENEVHPTQVKQWRDAAKAIVPEAFTDKRKSATKAADTARKIDELHRVIGVRDAELEWIKKNFMGSGCSLHPNAICPRDLSLLIEPDHPSLTVSRQAELLGLPRRSHYYQPVDGTSTQALLKRDMDAIDAVYTDYPFYGSRRMQLELLDR